MHNTIGCGIQHSLTYALYRNLHVQGECYIHEFANIIYIFFEKIYNTEQKDMYTSIMSSSNKRNIKQKYMNDNVNRFCRLTL